jgi:hypothetical protein
MLAALINVVTKWIPGLLPKLVTERPDLLIDHALAYAELAKSELEAVKRQVLRRAVAGAIAFAAGLSFFVLAGVALMLCATTQVRADLSWLLLAVPGVMLALTAIASMVALSKGRDADPGHSLTDQVRLDVQVFRAAMDARS